MKLLPPCRYHILKLNCTKVDFGWGSAPDPDGEAYSASLYPQLDLRGAINSNGREGKAKRGIGDERESESRGRDGMGRKGKGKKGEGGTSCLMAVRGWTPLCVANGMLKATDVYSRKEL